MTGHAIWDKKVLCSLEEAYRSTEVWSANSRILQHKKWCSYLYREKISNHICKISEKVTLIPLREVKDSCPGLRATISPSTNKLTGRLTR